MNVPQADRRAAGALKGPFFWAAGSLLFQWMECVLYAAEKKRRLQGTMKG